MKVKEGEEEGTEKRRKGRGRDKDLGEQGKEDIRREVKGREGKRVGVQRREGKGTDGTGKGRE